MRIGIVTPYFPPHVGGLEVVVASLAAEFAREHEVVVVTADAEGAPAHDAPLPYRVIRVRASVPLDRMGVPYPIPLGPGLRTAASALRACEVLHVHGALFATSVLAALHGRAKRVPYVVLEHAGWAHYESGALRAVQRAAWTAVGAPVLRAAAAVTTHSTRIAAFLEGFRALTSLQLIPNGVDCARFRPPSADERLNARARLGLAGDVPVALFAGRAVDKKGIDFIRAMRPDGWTLVACGADHGSLGDRVVNLGAIPYERMPEVLHAADVLLHPATGEGVTLIVKEAMASGVPVAMRWEAGHGDDLDPRLVAAYDRAEDLEATALALLRERSRRAELAASGRRWAESHWSWRAIAAEYLTLFERVAAAEAGNRRQ